MDALNELDRPENGVSDDLGGDGPEHMMEFRAPEIEAEGGGVDDVVSVDPETGEIPAEVAPVELIGKAAFYTVFKTSFGIPGMFSPSWKPLAIQPDEVEIARDASDAIYELLEIYYPAALMPQSETFGRIARAFPFVMAKVMIVRAILHEHRLAKMEAVNERRGDRRAPEFRSSRAPEAANDNNPPSSGTFDWMGAEQAVAA